MSEKLNTKEKAAKLSWEADISCPIPWEEADNDLKQIEYKAVRAILSHWADEVPKRPAWEAYRAIDPIHRVSHAQVKQIIRLFCKAALDEQGGGG